jgi:hypothetical protein
MSTVVLCLIKILRRENIWSVEIWFHAFLTTVVEVNFTPLQLYLFYIMERRPGGVKKRKVSCPCWESIHNSPPVQPVA